MSDTLERSRQRLARLTDALGAIMGASGATERTTIAELGLSSAHLVDLMIACEDIYAAAIDFSAIDIDYEMTIAALHAQLDRSADPETAPRPQT